MSDAAKERLEREWGDRYEQDAKDEASAACIPPWLALYMRLQAELNMLSSVSIEVPALRPAAKALREALG